MRLLLLCLLGVSATAFGAPAHPADELIPISRYGAERAMATADQVDPLSAIVEHTFSGGLTVGGAIERLLQHSGYRLPPPAARSPEFALLFELPLPAVFDHLGPLPLRDALSTLTGEAWQPVIDPVHRYIAFEVRDEYRDRFLAPAAAPAPAPAPVAAPVAAERVAPARDDAATATPPAPPPSRIARSWAIPSLAKRSATEALNELRVALKPNQRVELRYSSERAHQLLTRSMARRGIDAQRVEWRRDPQQPSFGAVASLLNPPPPKAVPFTTTDGSLHDNLRRLARLHAWEAPVWEASTPDFRVQGSYPLDVGSAASQFSQLLTPYPVAVCIHPANRTVRVLDHGAACQ